MKIQFLNQKFTLREIWKLRSSILKLFRFKKILNLAIVYYAKLFKIASMPAAPLILMIEPSSRCDMACRMCPVILNKTNRAKGDMSLDIFRKTISQIGDRLLAVALWNYGEPLLNPDIFSMISCAHARSIITLMSTNGLSLNREKINWLLDSGLDFLIVSFDGATKETYDKFRGEGNFDRVLNNLSLLTKVKRSRRAKSPFVDLQCIVMKENEHQIEDMRRLAEEIGVDKLSFKKFTYVGGAESKEFLPSKEEYIFGKYKYKGESYVSGCLRVIDSSVILWDGTVVPCCGDLSFAYKFGNINDHKFMDIWNSDRYIAFRKNALHNIGSLAICRTCPSKDYNADMFI